MSERIREKLFLHKIITRRKRGRGQGSATRSRGVGRGLGESAVSGGDRKEEAGSGVRHW